MPKNIYKIYEWEEDKRDIECYCREGTNIIIEYNDIMNNSINNNSISNNKINKSLKRIKDRYSNLNISDMDEDYKKMTKHIANKKKRYLS